MKDKRELLRIVRNNEGEIFVDPTGKKTDAALIYARAWNALAKLEKLRA